MEGICLPLGGTFFPGDIVFGLFPGRFDAIVSGLPTRRVIVLNELVLSDENEAARGFVYRIAALARVAASTIDIMCDNSPSGETSASDDPR